MKLSVLQEDLALASALASRFTSSRAQIPVLGNILIRAVGGKLILQATNLETGIHVPIGAKIEKEGELTVPAKILSELVSSLPQGRVEIEQEKDHLNVSSNSFSASIAGLPAQEFPKIPESAQNPTFVVKKPAFSVLSRQVAFASSMDETRPVLTGIYIEVGDKTMAVATDGFRMSTKDLTKGGLIEFGKESKKTFLLPARTIEELERSLPKDAENVKVEMKEKESQLIFDAESIVLTSRVIEGNYPDYKKVVPKADGTVIKTGRDELTKAVRAAGVFARESSGIVKISFGKSGMVLTSESAAFGKEQVVVEADVVGDDTQSAFNYKYLQEFLASVDGDTVEIKTQGPTSPAVFQDPKDPSYTHIIMPVRISS